MKCTKRYLNDSTAYGYCRQVLEVAGLPVAEAARVPQIVVRDRQGLRRRERRLRRGR